MAEASGEGTANAAARWQAGRQAAGKAQPDLTAGATGK